MYFASASALQSANNAKPLANVTSSVGNFFANKSAKLNLPLTSLDFKNVAVFVQVYSVEACTLLKLILPLSADFKS